MFCRRKHIVTFKCVCPKATTTIDDDGIVPVNRSSAIRIHNTTTPNRLCFSSTDLNPYHKILIGAGVVGRNDIRVFLSRTSTIIFYKITCDTDRHLSVYCTRRSAQGSGHRLQRRTRPGKFIIESAHPHRRPRGSHTHRYTHVIAHH